MACCRQKKILQVVKGQAGNKIVTKPLPPIPIAKKHQVRSGYTTDIDKYRVGGTY